MEAFLWSRSCTDFTGDAWKVLVKKCRDILLTEKAVLDRFDATTDGQTDDEGEEEEVPPRPIVRDRSGRCSFDHLIKRGFLNTEKWPQYSGEWKVKEDGWITTMSNIQTHAPYLSRDVLYKHFNVKLPKIPRSIRRGYELLESLERLNDLRIHRNPMDGRPTVWCVRQMVHASMHDRDYRVTMWLEVDLSVFTDSEDRLVPNVPPVLRILRAVCEPTAGGEACKFSGFGHGVFVRGCCTHVSTCAQAIHNLARPEGCVGAVVPPTSALCLWNDPGEGKKFPPEYTLSQILFAKPDSTREGPRRGHVSHRESKRGDMNPLKHPERNRRNSAERALRRAEFYKIANAGFADETMFRPRKAEGGYKIHEARRGFASATSGGAAATSNP
jgi:hypothetical protein